MSRKRRIPVATLLGVLVIAGLLAGVAYFAWQRSRPPGPPAPLSAEAARQLIHTKNVGLGLLENQRLEEGRESFVSIAGQAPDDPLAARNIAVARILALGVEFEEAPQEAIAAAKAALGEVQRIEGESTAFHWLALRVAAAERDLDAAEAHLQAIIDRQPEDAGAWYARYRIRRLADAAELDASAIEALAKAQELSPLNAWLLVEWLRVTARTMHSESGGLSADELQARYANLADRLQAARPSVQAFAYVIQAHAGIDPLALLDEAIQAARENDLATAATRMLVLANVLLPHSAADQQPVNRHPLEFLLDRFRPEFYTAAQISEVEPEPAIDVAFAASPAWQVSDALQAELGEVLDIALADFDLDGRLDIVALGAEAVVVWSRPADDQPWQPLATAAVQGMSRLVVQDLDLDFDETRRAVPLPEATDDQPADATPLKNICPTADVDLVLYGAGGITLLENRFDAERGERTLVPVPTDQLPGELSDVRAATCADLDADGDLDLAIATGEGLRLWANLGEWSFADISERSALPEGLSDVAQLVAFDWDRDIDIDVLIAAPSGGGWLENVRHGQFRWRTFAESFEPLAQAAAFEPIDSRGNASWDVVAGNANGARLVMTQTPRSGVLRAEAEARVSYASAAGVIAWDYDNDGMDDLLTWSSDSMTLLRGLGDGRFEPVDLLTSVPAPITRAAIGDLDGDGDLDLAVLSQGRVHLIENQGGNQNHWLVVALQAQQIKGQQLSPSGRVSPYGVGCLLELKAGSRYQARVVRGQTTHFGLGKQTAADVVRVGWLNGVPQNIIRPAADLFVCEQQVLNTSCPYVYAWNGERFVFVTDLLWNAPLGLQLAEGQLAPWRDWEYLKIPGELLAPREGEYVLQLTAELWEADYFDQIKLIAVDHPADVAIYSNEKVGPAEIAEYKIHTVRQPQIPLSARNHAGRNLLPEIAREDGMFARTYERKLRQGVVEDHFLELDLGDLRQAEHLTLYLTGWVFPASTSINVALSQGSSVSPPRPPWLEVSDGNGGWREVTPFMGFPGGKTKTIAVELDAANLTASGAGPPHADASTRLRIHTSMELYWDQIFFTVDERPAEVRTAELELASADLHDRGFSRVAPDTSGKNGPEQFLYDEVSQLPKWPPMEGRFTRYGDVAELLRQSDDRLLVIGAGDEVTLRFSVPDKPPPPGWKRDFLLYSVGWDKDANLQTVAGKTVEPLPFRAMTAYPWPPNEKLPDSDAYRQYLREYQTREHAPAYWKSILRPTALEPIGLE